MQQASLGYANPATLPPGPLTHEGRHDHTQAST